MGHSVRGLLLLHFLLILRMSRRTRLYIRSGYPPKNYFGKGRAESTTFFRNVQMFVSKFILFLQIFITSRHLSNLAQALYVSVTDCDVLSEVFVASFNLATTNDAKRLYTFFPRTG